MDDVTVVRQGRVVPVEGAISALDRGFLYGDAVFEVLAARSGRPEFLERHLARLMRSAERLGFALEAAPEARWRTDVEVALAEVRGPDVYLRLIWSRGQGLGMTAPEGEPPLRLVLARPIALERQPESVSAVLVRGRRFHRGGDGDTKTGNYLGSVLAVRRARASGAEDALRVDDRGLVVEGATSNVFALFDRNLVTPPLDGSLLPGITRAAVLEVAPALGLRGLELPLTPEALAQADEVFLTSSVRGLTRVVALEGAPIGTGRNPAGGASPTLAALRTAYVDAARA